MTELSGAGVGGARATRVLLVDDQALVRSGFRALLSSAPDIEVLAEAADGAEAVSLVRAHRPDVVLMDVRMPRVDGLAAAREILGDPRLAAVRVIMLTTFDVDEYVFEALRVGASGFLLKDIEPAELRDAVRVVARGDALLAPSVTKRLIARFAEQTGSGPTGSADPSGARAAATALIGRLTAREREIVELVATGMTNEEIAARLVLSPATVKTHVNRAMAKVDARDRAQLVVLAYQSGLVQP